MKNDKTNDRRNFLKTAGAALVAASVPAALAAQTVEAGGAQNNSRQMIVFGGIAEPNPNLSGVFGLACFQFQMRADLNDGSGHATLSDPIVSEVNSHIQTHSVLRAANDSYIFRGIVKRSLNSELLGRAVVVKVRVLDPHGDCNVSLTVEDTPLAIGLLLPAIQKVR